MKDFKKFLELEHNLTLTLIGEEEGEDCKSKYYINEDMTIGLHKVFEYNGPGNFPYYMYSIGEKDGKEKEIISVMNFIDHTLDLDKIVFNLVAFSNCEQILQSHQKALDGYTLLRDESRIKDNLVKLADNGKEYFKEFVKGWESSFGAE